MSINRTQSNDNNNMEKLSFIEKNIPRPKKLVEKYLKNQKR